MKRFSLVACLCVALGGCITLDGGGGYAGGFSHRDWAYSTQDQLYQQRQELLRDSYAPGGYDSHPYIPTADQFKRR